MPIKYLCLRCSKVLNLSGFDAVNKIGRKYCEGCGNNDDNLLVVDANECDCAINNINNINNNKHPDHLPIKKNINIISNFEKWLRTVCFKTPTPEAYDLAKLAWDASEKLERKQNPYYRKHHDSCTCIFCT